MAKKFSFVPLGDRIVVKPAEKGGEQKLASGIIIPETVNKQESKRGEVVAVGPGSYREGKLIPVQIKIGDEVLFHDYSSDKIRLEGEEYFIVPESNVIGILR